MNVVKNYVLHVRITVSLNRFESTLTNRRRVVVTGIGAVSPLGNNVQQSWRKILACESAVSKLDDSFKGLPCQVAARVQRAELDLEKHFSKSDMKLMSSGTLLTLLAAHEAITAANLDTEHQEQEQRERIGVCVGMGMFDLTEVYTAYSSLQKGYNRVSPYFVPRLLPNMPCGHISMRYGLRGPNHSVSTACATGAHAIGDAMRFIRSGDADVMLAGSGECCIDPLSVAGFCRLRALSTAFNDRPATASRPFDSKRDGFVMGEGAAILILEELNYARRRRAPILAEILGYGLSGDAYHITSPSEDGTGAFLAMKRAIADANITSDCITYINAHATSTPLGDKIEAHAINRVLGEHAASARVSSTKGAHGHLLGSSGNLEAVFVVKACAENVIPPSINIEHLDDDIGVNVVTQPLTWQADEKRRRIALKNSFGFGGTNASLCIASYEE